MTIDDDVHAAVSDQGTLIGTEHDGTQVRELKPRRKSLVVVQHRRTGAFNMVYWHDEVVYTGRTADGKNFKQERYVPGEWERLVKRYAAAPVQLQFEFSS
jgi:hypothetical protein